MRSNDTSAPYALRRKAKAPVRFAKQLDELAAAREQRIAEIDTLRQAMASKFLDDAARLLSGRYWARAGVQSRQQLLAAADWLLTLARNSATPVDGVRAAPPLSARATRLRARRRAVAARPRRVREHEPEPA